MSPTETNETPGRRRLSGFDLGVLLIVALCLAGFVLAKKGYAGVDQVIEGKSKVAIDVFISGLKTEDLEVFKVGEKSAITIRNQPVEPPMTIAKVSHWQKQVSFLSADGKRAIAFPDPANAIAHDYLVTVTDAAEKTKDGWVIRGNKIKLGNLIELEGFKYRVQGVVADIHPVDN